MKRHATPEERLTPEQIAAGIEEYLQQGRLVQVSQSSWRTIIAALRSETAVRDPNESGWTPEQALRFYADSKHFDVVDGLTHILDTGAVASDALKGMSEGYAAAKGCDVRSASAHTDHPLRHFDRTCPACIDGARTDVHTISASEPSTSAPSESLHSAAAGVLHSVIKYVSDRDGSWAAIRRSALDLLQQAVEQDDSVPSSSAAIDLSVIEEAFPLVGEHESDARHIWPSRWRAVKDDLTARSATAIKERWIVAREHAADVGEVRLKLGYIIVHEWPTFDTHDDAVSFLKSRDLPLGWVVMKESQLRMRGLDRTGA